MLVTCHQPHFLPWIPYLNKIAHSDLFLVLDDVDYRKQYFQNRTRIVDSKLQSYWITLPVNHVHLGTPISQVLLATSSRDLRISINRLKMIYKDYTDTDFLRSVLGILENPPEKLIDINMKLLDLVLQRLRMPKPNIVPISTVARKMQRDARILTALKEVNATSVILGTGNMAAAHDIELWKQSGISIEYQKAHTIPSNCSLQLGIGISVIHDILASGHERTAEIVKNYWIPRKNNGSPPSCS